MPGVTEGDVNVPVAPAGIPVADSATAFEKLPFCGVTVMVYIAVPPAWMICAPLDELMVKVGGGAPEPSSVTDCGEPAALSATSSVAVKLPTETGLNVT